jgi:LmbE family N-acetylglucosaminyl deacetylase
MPLKLLCIVAHPDDESLGLGGILAKYGAEGVETHLVTVTRGELGWFGPEEENPGPERLAQIRAQELSEAARVLGIADARLMEYCDGEVREADQSVLLRQLVGHIRRARPDVIVTFDQFGVYGHPDHIAVTRSATAACIAAADPSFDGPETPHTTRKLYYYAWRRDAQLAYERAFGDLVMEIDGVERRAVPWPDWAVTAVIDTSPYWEQVWEAIRCHRSQLPGYQKLLDLPEEYHQTLWGQSTFHRVYTLVPTAEIEDDLFDGLRGGAAT